MAYFKFLPNIEYLSPFDSPTNDARILAKNLFRRIKIADGANILDTAYIFDKYIIEEGDRPDNVALKVYGNSNFDWLVIFSAGIVHQRDEWPLSSQQLYDFAADRYGNDLNSIRYYTTTEIKDSNGRLVLPSGQIVDKDFTIPDPDTPTVSLNPVTSVTNYEYEYDKNEKKREINLIKPSYKQRIFNELEDILNYKPNSSQYISKTLKTTENIKKKSP
jgi:hypothetical protein